MAEADWRGEQWLRCMMAGNFEDAWKQSDALRTLGVHDPHRFWDGAPLTGKRVIVRCLHGYGDAVQMLRYASPLQMIAAHVLYEVAPRFVELARCIRGVHNVITWGDNAPTHSYAWDSQVELMELPYIFRTQICDLPIIERYVVIPEILGGEAARRLSEDHKLRIGLVWTAGAWNMTRSLPFEELLPLLAMSEFSFWNLQGGEAAREADSSRMANSSSLCDEGLVPLGAYIAKMDLVITVDTLAAHLAGAIGKPVWLMLQYAADWRWMAGREDTPWYRTMRIFRQSEQGDWKTVIAAIVSALRSRQW